MRSLRLDPALDDKIRRAAAATGLTVSAFIRRAVAERADAVLAERPRSLFADVAGAVHGGGGRAERTGEVFSKVLAERSSRT